MENPPARSVEETKPCDDCGELTYRFCRETPDALIYGLNRPDHLILGYYCPGCHVARLESFVDAAPPATSTHPLDEDWRVRFPLQLEQENLAYSRNRVGRQLLWAYPFLRKQRDKRSLLGRKVTRADDARVSLRFTDATTCSSDSFLATLRDYIVNGCKSSAVEHEMTPAEVWVHADVSDRPRLHIHLARLERRFPMIKGYQVYYYNEGQRYEYVP